MIAWLSGRIVHKGMNAIVLDVNGVGYELHVSLRDLEALPPVQDLATIHVHTHVREDAIQLFGFHDAGAKRLFLELVAISGVGPKIALSALSVYEAAELRAIILDGDITRLTRVSGVGKKTAQRVVLELAEKLRGIDLGGDTSVSAGSNGVLEDLRSALAGLGFNAKKVDAVVEEVASDARDGLAIEELLKRALALLRS